jgi:arylsulfatase
MKDGRIHEAYNFGGLEWTTVSSTRRLAEGKHTIVYEFLPDSATPGAGATSRLNVDGVKVAEAQIRRTMPYAYSGDEGVDVGTDNETPVTKDYEERNNKFTGKILKVTVELK